MIQCYGILTISQFRLSLIAFASPPKVFHQPMNIDPFWLETHEKECQSDLRQVIGTPLCSCMSHLAVLDIEHCQVLSVIPRNKESAESWFVVREGM
jgi:hypothetical protein